MKGALVRAQGLRRIYVRRGQPFEALSDVSLTLEEGTITGLVGCSGGGKSTLCRLVAGFERPDGGTIQWNFDRRRPWAVQYLFQHPHRSLTPYRTLLQLVTEPLEYFTKLSAQERRNRAAKALEELGLGPELWDRKPGQVSGGQAQRAALARAMILKPEVLLLDEPVSSLDAPAQAQVLNAVKALWKRSGVTCLFVAHDLAAVDFLCHRVGVMLDGRMVEQGSREQVLDHPSHPFTRRLVDLARQKEV